MLRALGLGDLCTAVPALRALRRAHPEHELTLAAPAWQQPLARLAAVDRVLPTSELVPLPTAAGRPDLAVNLHGRGPQSTRRLLQLHPRRLIAYRHPDLPETAHGPRWRADEHEIVRWCRLLEEAGICCDPGEIGLARPDSASLAPGAVVVHPGAAAEGRRWPAERFAVVVRRLVEMEVRVAITGTDGEAELASRVVELAGCTPPGSVLNLAGRTTVDVLCALVAEARAVVCNDTGIAHVASAYGTPSVVLFGPTSPAVWGPRTGPHIALWKGIRGDPHGRRLDPGLAAIGVDEVLEALERVLNSPRSSSAGRGVRSSP